MSVNKELAAIFDRMGQIVELTGGNRFRAISFERAARALGDMTDDVGSMADDIHKLMEIEGIGKGLAERIAEYVHTGHIQEYDDLVKQVPPGVLELLDIPGLGPKTVAMFWKEAGIGSVADLKQKLESGELEKLPRMGAKSVQKIAKSLQFAQSAGQRFRIGDAMAVAERIVEDMKKVKGVEQADYAGSLRRGRDSIGDVDVLVSCRDAAKHGKSIHEAFRTMSCVKEVIAAGAAKSSVRTDDNIQADLRVVEADQYGAALMYFTGSKAHNIALRERAIKRKLKLNEYGLWKDDGDEKAKPVAAKTEQEIYKALKLAYIPPEMREDRGEIALAEKDAIPSLVELDDIKCELHAHTTASDGVLSIEELAVEAKRRGFHTIAVTDHSVSQPIANGLSVERLEKHIEAIRAAASKVKGITILAGSEVDILADGRLDYPDSILKELDIVIASPHSALSQPTDKATKRLLKAIEHRYVHIIGHPTGRLIGRREGLNLDMAALFKAAAEAGTAMEINANHWRLDLNDIHAHAAIEAGVMLAINTDAHHVEDFAHLRYGVLTARRAWAQKKHVLNCMTAAKLKAWLAKKR